MPNKKSSEKNITFHFLTIFPEILDSYIHESLFKHARKKKIVKFKFHNLRDFTTDQHRVVDDRPFGGGPGMVLKIEPIYKAIAHIKSHIARRKTKTKTRIILLSARGKKFIEKDAKRLSKYTDIVFICGRYEGVDERVAEHVADEEISVGDYVLSGGELPAMLIAEAVSRMIPGFLGSHESLEDPRGSFPAYTRPAKFVPKNKKGWKVPDVLLSGDHKKIEEWRRENS